MTACKLVLSMLPGLPGRYGRLAVILSLSALVTGCAALGLSDDKNDVCYAQRVELRGAGSYYAKSILGGAAIGAAAGAALGAVTAAITGNSAGKGAVIGAVGGGVVGGIGGYFRAKQSNINDAQTLAASVQSDLIRENGEIDRASIAFARARDCRFANAERIKGDFRAGRLQREEALKQLTYLKTKFDEDITIAEELGTKMSANMTEFQYASSQMLDQDAESRELLARMKAPPPESQATTRTACGSKGKRSRKSAGCSKTSRKSARKTTQTVQAPVKKTPVVEAALAAESNQLKQKDYADTVSKSKAVAASGKFDLDAKTDGNSPLGLFRPESLLCGL